MYKFFVLLLLGIIIMTSCIHQTTLMNNEEEKIDESLRPTEPLAWESTGILINPKSDDTHTPVSIKDPTVVFYEGEWHIYATIYDTAIKTWNMVYLSFSDWSEADSAPLFYMDTNPALRGYKCAPQVFYFEPQKKWYLIYQSQPPTYSTAKKIGKPENWSAPKYFYSRKPKNAPSLWIDYWIICDSKNAYMFFSGDDGKLYRSQTTLKDFPEGFGEITIVMEFPERRDLFEACNIYKIKGMKRYVLLNECADTGWTRYFKAFISDSLTGTWYELAASDKDPFCGLANVTFESGVTPWTRDFSHGELLRDGYDQTLTIDGRNLQFLYQGQTAPGSSYELISWSIGMLKQVSPPPSQSIFAVDLKTLTPYSGEIHQSSEIKGNEGDPNVLVAELEYLSDQSGFSPLEVFTDSDASGGKAIEWPGDGSEQYLDTPSDDAPGQAIIAFTLTEKANVQFDMRMNMANGDNDSFYYKVDMEEWNTQNNLQTDGYEIKKIATFHDLGAGMHTIRILRREDGSKLDKVILKASTGKIYGE